MPFVKNALLNPIVKKYAELYDSIMLYVSWYGSTSFTQGKEIAKIRPKISKKSKHSAVLLNKPA